MLLQYTLSDGAERKVYVQAAVRNGVAEHAMLNAGPLSTTPGDYVQALAQSHARLIETLAAKGVLSAADVCNIAGIRVVGTPELVED